MNTYSPQVIDTIEAHDAVEGSSRWEAFLDIKLESAPALHAPDGDKVNGAKRTRMAHCRHQGPLYVQRPFFPEGETWPHIYLLHPPGGVVSGDCLKIKIEAGTKSSGLFTTPGAGRVYRARKDKTLQGQHIHLIVGENAHLEWFPLENILYPGAHAELTTRVDLTESSKLFMWDISSYGLPAQNELFEEGSVLQNIRIYVNGRPRIIERLLLDEKSACRIAGAGLRSKPIAANFIAGPWNINKDNKEAQESILNTLRTIAEVPCFRDKQRLVGVSVVHGFIVARYLGHCSESAKKLFAEFWKVLRPELMCRDACIPRIWST